jgi:hypothetical protein
LIAFTVAEEAVGLLSIESTKEEGVLFFSCESGPKFFSPFLPLKVRVLQLVVAANLEYLPLGRCMRDGAQSSSYSRCITKQRKKDGSEFSFNGCIQHRGSWEEPRLGYLRDKEERDHGRENQVYF